MPLLWAGGTDREPLQRRIADKVTRGTDGQAPRAPAGTEYGMFVSLTLMVHPMCWLAVSLWPHRKPRWSYRYFEEGLALKGAGDQLWAPAASDELKAL